MLFRSHFDDFKSTYVVGSIALAVILFDGGLRTPRSSFALAMWPALSLATLGILLTAVFAGLLAMIFLGVSPLAALLIGGIVASTDAAAVFLLLHGRGTEISKRLSATLEVESGVNDPMAVFLTIACVEILAHPGHGMEWHVVTDFLWQMIGGALIASPAAGRSSKPSTGSRSPRASIRCWPSRRRSSFSPAPRCSRRAASWRSISPASCWATAAIAPTQ